MKCVRMLKEDVDREQQRRASVVRVAGEGLSQEVAIKLRPRGG